MATADNSDPACQGQEGAAFSRRSIPLTLYRFFWYLRTTGIFETAKRSASHLMMMAGRRPPKTNKAAAALDVPLGLEPGDWVEIKSEAEILATVDKLGRMKGLQFMPQMRQYCGTRARVYKRLERLLFEESQQRRRVTNTVILEGLICDGDGVGCDRSCFFFWREAWLRRTDPPEPSSLNGAPAIHRTPANKRTDLVSIQTNVPSQST